MMKKIREGSVAAVFLFVLATMLLAGCGRPPGDRGDAAPEQGEIRQSAVEDREEAEIVVDGC